MNNNRLFGIGIALAIIAFIISQAFYTVREDKQALVLLFGEPVRAENAYGEEPDAGLKFKIPFFEAVRQYDRKNLVLDLAPQPILASDQDTLGSVESPEIISGQRVSLMDAIEVRANARAEEGRFGLKIEDVRIKRADLPAQNASRVFNRMAADRQEQSAEKRGEGERSKRTIIAEADKDVQILIANARKQSEIIKGEGDKERNRIYAEAYNLDPEFFAFYRSMEAYRKGLGNKSTYVLSPDSDFLGYLDNQAGPGRR